MLGKTEGGGKEGWRTEEELEMEKALAREIGCGGRWLGLGKTEPYRGGKVRIVKREVCRGGEGDLLKLRYSCTERKTRRVD